MSTFEIEFDDLNEAAQKRFLKFQGLENPEQGNFDISPIACIDLEKGDVY